MRPIWYEFPKDENTFSMTEMFMWGDAIMVAPKIRGSVNPHFDLYDQDQVEDKVYPVDVYLAPVTT